jgi:hypothetical protein
VVWLGQISAPKRSRFASEHRHPQPASLASKNPSRPLPAMAMRSTTKAALLMATVLSLGVVPPVYVLVKNFEQHLFKPIN